MQGDEGPLAGRNRNKCERDLWVLGSQRWAHGQRSCFYMEGLVDHGPGKGSLGI